MYILLIFVTDIFFFDYTDIAKIDHLPEYHSPEALALLRRAWCDIDAYHAYADEYKWYAKVTYACMLVLGLTIAISAAYFSRFRAPPRPDCICDAETRAEVNAASDRQDDADRLASQVTVLLSLLSSVVAGISTFTNPGSRWQHLRSSALTLESEIWSFRTRTGKFREGMNAQGRVAETVFHEKINDSGESTLSSGDLRRTEFYAQSESGSGFLKHNQFRPADKNLEKPFCFDCSNLIWQLIARCCCCYCKSKSLESNDIKRVTEELDQWDYKKLLERANKLNHTNDTESGTLLSSLENERSKYIIALSRKRKERERELKREKKEREEEEEEEEEGEGEEEEEEGEGEEEEEEEEEETEEKEKERRRCNGKHKLMKLRQFGNCGCDDCGDSVQGSLCYSCRGCDEDYCSTCFKGGKDDLISWDGTYTASSGSDAGNAVGERDDKDLFVKRLNFKPRVFISENDLNKIASGVKKPDGILTDLDLSGVQFKPFGWLYLNQTLKAPNNCITHLNLSDTHIVDTQYDKADVNDIFDRFSVNDILKDFSTLFESLHLHQKVTHLFMRKLDADFIKWTLKPLKNTGNKQNIWQSVLTSVSSKIQHLDVSSNPQLTERTHDTSLLESIMTALTQETCSITSIDLSHCNIGDNDVTYIVDVLKNSSNKITHMNLEGNNILEQGTEKIMKGLTHMSCRITTFDFSVPPNESPEIQNKIADHMKDVLSHPLCIDVDSTIDLSKLSIQLKLFRHPRNISKLHKLECPRDHQLACYECKETEIDCNVCNKKILTKMPIFGCYICGWDVCTMCKTKMVMKRFVECEILRKECEELGISKYHIRQQEDQLKRLKFTDYAKQLTSMQNSIKLHHLKKEAKAKGVTKKDVLQTLGFNTDTDRAQDTRKVKNGRDNEKKRKEENEQKRKDSLVSTTNWARTIEIQVRDS